MKKKIKQNEITYNVWVGVSQFPYIAIIFTDLYPSLRGTGVRMPIKRRMINKMKERGNSVMILVWWAAVADMTQFFTWLISPAKERIAAIPWLLSRESCQT
jgi:hypothetical protein